MQTVAMKTPGDEACGEIKNETARPDNLWSQGVLIY